MDGKICYIVGAGDFFEKTFSPAPGSLVIAADGGYSHLKRVGVIPDIVIGDFDSFCDKTPKANEIIRLKKEKDDTDTLAAIRIGLERGFDSFYIFGGTGGRNDHTLANIQCLAFLAQRKACGYLYFHNEIATAICGGSVSFGEEHRGYISVFAYGGDARGVTLMGLKYELCEAELKCDFPVGVSNEFTGKKSSVSVKDGTVIIIYGR